MQHAAMSEVVRSIFALSTSIRMEWPNRKRRTCNKRSTSRRFEAVEPQVHALIATARTYGGDDPETRLEVFVQIGDLLSADSGFGFRVRSTVADQGLLERWEEVLAWWMQAPDAPAPDADQLRGWQRFVADNLDLDCNVAPAPEGKDRQDRW
jgi:hypothetical protein